MAKYIDLISDNTKKHSEANTADAQVAASKLQLEAAQQVAEESAAAALSSDETLTVAVALQPQGVLDPSTGIVYQVIGGVLHQTKPSNANELDVPDASGEALHPVIRALRSQKPYQF